MNILLFGPNGSGKGTQGSLLAREFGLCHIESGAIFRRHLAGGTELGRRARVHIERGELVPDDLTVPMVLEVLAEARGNGWLLDGFPRTIAQAEALWTALQADGTPVDCVVELRLDRSLARERILGRRLCEEDANHPNNTQLAPFQPGSERCRVCGSCLSRRRDDQDERAIDTRHDIYYDTLQGTLGAVAYFRERAARYGFRDLPLDATGTIAEIQACLLQELGQPV